MSNANYQTQTVFPPPLVEGNQTFHTITDAICRVVEAPPSKGWIASFLSGEGLVCTFQGQGTVYLQSRNASEYGAAVGALLPPREG